MKQADKIKELEERVRQLEQAPRTYPVYVPYYVQPPPFVPVTPNWPNTAPWPYVVTCGTDATGVTMFASLQS